MKNAEFYPEQKSIEIHPIEDQQPLRYFLDGLSEDSSPQEFELKLAFPSKWNLQSPKLKQEVRKILAKIIAVSNFTIDQAGEQVVVDIPIRTLTDTSLLPEADIVKIPVLVKLVETTESGEVVEYKCRQEILLNTNSENNEDEDEGLEEGNEENHFDDDDEQPDYSEDADGADGDEYTEGEDEYEGEDEEAATVANVYSGLLAIDYGTANSSVAVRDPSFAAEEVRGQLGTDQWEALCEWMDMWLTDHLSSLEPDSVDVFIKNLTLVIPTAEFPECGAPKTDITQALNRFDEKLRIQFLSELIGRLSNFVKDGGDSEAIKGVASETMQGFEASIDSQNLESQRYFVLELDKNVGPAPISSVLQIIDAPESEDPDRLTEETKIDMGARVGLLLHSAATGELDIRQFVLSSKRYFGRDEIISVVPAESGGREVNFPSATLAKITYKELFSRSVSDIHRRSEEGKFEDAEWLCSVVATFPTSYPAASRHLLREILNDLNIREVDTRFDEATAAAIFHIWREIGADPVCGMHGLMARSRKDKYGRSYQNILLYDLGGGTTDIALIQLLYEEIEIFEPGEDRGHGGSYFRITPRLLGTTGHAYLGGDLLTLWVFRYLKSRLADQVLTHITQNNLEPPMDSPLGQLMMNMPDDLIDNEDDPEALPRYRPGALLEWTVHPSQNLRNYDNLNEKVIDKVIPTRFIDDSSKISNFFTLWEISDELKKTLGTPIIENFGTVMASTLPENWPDELELDSGQLYNFMQMAQGWLVETGAIQQDDLALVVTQEDMNNVIMDTIKQSLSLAASLAIARLQGTDETQGDRIDRLILSGLSCNMKAVQQGAHEIFTETSGIFDYDPANVRFDRDSAKTAVPLGACIGRYMESVRVDPFNEKTRQLLRDGYDQIELIIENLFSYLPCRIAYDSLVAMVTIFRQGQELNVKSYWDKEETVARTSIKDFRPVQEKFWIYRIDFEGAEPQYLGLIDAEAVAADHDFENFRQFREEYVVGFEVNSDMAIRCFFLPKGQTTIVLQDYHEPVEGEVVPQIIESISDYRARNVKNDDDEDEYEEDPYQEEPEEEPEEEPATEEENNEDVVFDEDAEDSEENPEDTDDDEEAEDDGILEDDGVEEETDDEMSEENASSKSKAIKSEEEFDPQFAVNTSIQLKETLAETTAIHAGAPLNFRVQYPSGETKDCTLSLAVHIRDEYDFKLQEAEGEDPSDDLVARFEIDESETEEATLICDQDGKLVMTSNCLFDIEIYAEIEYVAQKVNAEFDPFCGTH
ncbi:hypothetical protein [Candidatus Uabimicrobium sp. HlEnr_7]|uniref:hypothetical protein n=1 Tax=Candidatus Uabimicrobium helgolandensis TaxID=3095367 RepID=UPI00355716C1